MQGIVHRDVKPGNFLFSRKANKGHLIDFNLAMVSATFLDELCFDFELFLLFFLGLRISVIAFTYFSISSLFLQDLNQKSGSLSKLLIFFSFIF